MHDPIATEIVNGLRVAVYYDPDSYHLNPRENDNVARIYGETSRYIIGDGKPPSDEQAALDRGGLRLLARYLRLAKGAVALRAVNLYDHSGVSYSTGAIEDAGRQGWDAYTAGYAYVTRAGWAATGRTDDPTGPYVVDTRDDKYLARTLAGLTNAEATIEYEVREYGQWANGEVYGYTVTRPCTDTDKHDEDDTDPYDCDHAEEVDACWGFVGEDDYAMSEGKASAIAFTREEGAA